MCFSHRLLTLFAVTLFAATTLHAQEDSTSTTPTQPRKMTVQAATSLVIGPDPFTLGADLRVFIPINSLRGMRLIPSLGITSFAMESDNGTVIPFSFKLDIAYSFARFGGRNGGLYGKIGPVYDIQIGESETSNALGLDLGLGLQGNVGSFDMYLEVGRVFSDLRRTEIIIGTTYGK